MTPIPTCWYKYKVDHVVYNGHTHYFGCPTFHQPLFNNSPHFGIVGIFIYFAILGLIVSIAIYSDVRAIYISFRKKI